MSLADRLLSGEVLDPSFRAFDLMLASNFSIFGLLKGLLLGIAVAIVFSAGVADASIMRPEMPEFKFEESSTSQSSSSAPADPAPEAPAEKPIVDLVALQALSGGSGSSSSSSSGSSPTSSNSTVALGSLTVSSLADLALSGWVSSELRFSLPTPPGNDLLRPPQDFFCSI